MNYLKVKLIFPLFLLSALLSCIKKINIPETFPRDEIEVAVVVDSVKPFEVGFVNPTYYYKYKTEKQAKALINEVKPLDYTFTSIKKYLENRFENTKIKIKNVVIKNIPLMENTFNGPPQREPVINPEINLEKIKSKINVKYILHYRIRYLRLSLDVRPGVKDSFIISPAIALYDVNKKVKIYLWYLGTPGGIKTDSISFNLHEYKNIEKNQQLIKTSIDKIIKITGDKLTENLVKHFN